MRPTKPTFAHVWKSQPKALDPERDASLIEERDRLRGDYVQAQFVAAMLLYEEAWSYDESSPQRRQKFLEAETAFGEVAKKYRRRLAGLSAVLFQGRCQQQLGELRKALSDFEDLLTLPDGETVLRPLKTKALRGAMECWLDPKVQQYEAARQRAEAWLEQQRPNERGDDDWLAVAFLLAKTYHLAAQGEAAGRDQAALLREARRLAIEVAKYRGESQEGAQALLADLGHSTQPVAETVQAKTFAEAVDAARDALSRRQVAAQTVRLIEQRQAQLADAAAGRKQSSG